MSGVQRISLPSLTNVCSCVFARTEGSDSLVVPVASGIVQIFTVTEYCLPFCRPCLYKPVISSVDILQIFIEQASEKILLIFRLDLIVVSGIGSEGVHQVRLIIDLIHRHTRIIRQSRTSIGILPGQDRLLQLPGYLLQLRVKIDFCLKADGQILVSSLLMDSGHRGDNIGCKYPSPYISPKNSTANPWHLHPRICRSVHESGRMLAPCCRSSVVSPGVSGSPPTLPPLTLPSPPLTSPGYGSPSHSTRMLSTQLDFSLA